MKTQTLGHLTCSQGIRGHSAGSIFPYMIIVIGSPAAFHYTLVGQGVVTGEFLAPFNSDGYDILEQIAMVLLNKDNEK